MKRMKELTMIIENLSAETNLSLTDGEIKIISETDNSLTNDTSLSMDQLYNYLVANNNKTQYVVTFCYER